MRLPGIPAFRVEMISMAVVMINYVLKRTGIRKIITSDYALKEAQSNYINSFYNYLISALDIQRTQGTIKQYINQL